MRSVGAGFGPSLSVPGPSLSESSVEKHVNTIFSKLGLAEERSLSRRVAAVLTYPHDTNGPVTS